MPRIVGLITFFLLLFTINSLPQKYQILEKNAEYAVIKFDFRDFAEMRDTIVNGRKFTWFSGEGMYFIKAGEPTIPEYSVSLGINYNANPKIQIIASEKGRVDNRFILPFTLIDSLTFEPDQLFYDKDVYNSDKNFPNGLARLEGRYSFRFAEVQPVILSPYQYNPVSREIVKYNSITVRVDFNNQYNDGFTVQGIEDVATLEFLQNAVLNFDEAKNWIGEKKNLKDGVAVQSDNWYNPDKQYFKLFLNKKDVYKLTYDELVAAGMPTDRNIRVEKLQIFSTSGEVPLSVFSNNSRFSSGDYIIFVGDSVPPSPYTKMNLYNKSNIFWFSYEADTAGLRYISKTGSPTVSQPEVNTVKATVRWENDEIYERLGWAPNEKEIIGIGKS
ncbi:MAG: hypothetical protein IPN18_05525 [Ignavibacteriales bacterium]|nr:hypothetical protein [Ignavibacteriales bacterium]